MKKYKSKCRYNLLLHIDGSIKEIRPGEIFEASEDLDLKYVKRLAGGRDTGPEDQGIEKKKVIKPAPKAKKKKTIGGELDASTA